MPGRKKPTGSRGGKSRPSLMLRSSHDGVYQEKTDAHDSSHHAHDEGWKKKQVLANQQEEGVLYTVKVVQRVSGTQPLGRNDVAAPPPGQPMLPDPQQYTVSKVHTQNLSWVHRFCKSFGVELTKNPDVDSHLYKPSKPLARYINWTFYASFFPVFLSFLGIFVVLSLLFAVLFLVAGEIQPDCIVVSGNNYGDNPDTKFGDAFALSWTTFTTVGYGNTYPASGLDYETANTRVCSGVVFLCTLEAFMGLIYAGMCAAIMFGKVNRVQSHAHLTFANAVCLQYEEVDTNQFVDDYSSDSDCECDVIMEEDDEVSDEKKAVINGSRYGRKPPRTTVFREQFKGCPILKFQVVNDLCNKAGAEIIDGMMKVVGMKLKRNDGKITHSQYVRVNLVDYEHPFFGRVWHGVHILDGSSPLLTNTAKEKIKANGGSWPNEWVEQPQKVRRKLDFDSLVITVSGISNVSASAVHAYKRYKFEDVIIGFDFAPLVYEEEDENAGKLEVDLGLINDVREQQKGGGESLDSPVVHARSKDFTRGTSSIFKLSKST